MATPSRFATALVVAAGGAMALNWSMRVAEPDGTSSTGIVVELVRKHGLGPVGAAFLALVVVVWGALWIFGLARGVGTASIRKFWVLAAQRPDDATSGSDRHLRGASLNMHSRSPTALRFQNLSGRGHFIFSYLQSTVVSLSSGDVGRTRLPARISSNGSADEVRWRRARSHQVSGGCLFETHPAELSPVGAVRTSDSFRRRRSQCLDLFV